MELLYVWAVYLLSWISKEANQFLLFCERNVRRKKKGSKLRVLHSTRLRIQFQVFAAYCFSCIYMSSCCLFKIKLEEKKKNNTYWNTGMPSANALCLQDSSLVSQEAQRLAFYLAVCPPAAAVPADPSPGPAPEGGCGHVPMAQKGLCRPRSQVCRCWQRWCAVLLLRKQRQEWAEQSHGTAGRSGLCAVCFRISLSLIIFLSLGKKNKHHHCLLLVVKVINTSFIEVCHWQRNPWIWQAHGCFTVGHCKKATLAWGPGGMPPLEFRAQQQNCWDAVDLDRLFFSFTSVILSVTFGKEAKKKIKVLV